MTGLYVYGIVQADRTGHVPLDPASLGTGIGGAAISYLAAGSLVALTSPADAPEVTKTRRNMIAHTKILERAIATTDVLPLRFGTVAPDAPTLTRCIGANAREFHAALAGIGGHVELGVKASWRQGVIFSEIIVSDSEIRRLRDRLQQRSANEAYYERIELGRRVEAMLAERRQAETAAIVAELGPLAARQAELRTQDDELVFNRAFLVRRENEAAFDAQLQAVSERHAGRMEFRYIGPVPPYNFVSLQVEWLRGTAAAAGVR